jgi:hypothetical protein
MPFAWTAVYLMSVINQANTLDAEKEQQSSSDSLGNLILICSSERIFTDFGDEWTVSLALL